MKITLDTQEVDVTSLGQLDPTHVLFEADGPRLFTSRDANARTLLVYLCCEDTINALEQGCLSLRDALGQSSGWLVSTTADGHPVRAQVASLAFLPKMAVPAPNIPLCSVPPPLALE